VTNSEHFARPWETSGYRLLLFDRPFLFIAYCYPTRRRASAGARCEGERAREPHRALIELERPQVLGDVPVLKGISMFVRRARQSALSAPRGRAKSTILRCIKRLIPVTKAFVRVARTGCMK